MALPTSGPLSLNQIHVEAGGTSGTTVSLNDSDVRGLIGKGSGVTMSVGEWYGASSAPAGGGPSTANCTSPSFLSNAYWTGNDAVWNGTYWEGDPGSYINFDLNVNGAWAAGYRPSTLNIKVYRGNGMPWEMTVRDTANAAISSTIDIDQQGSIGSVYQVNIPLTFGANDIGSISSQQFVYSSAVRIYCIKFS